MQSESETRSRYLALALDARKIVDVLMAYLDTGSRNQQLSSAVAEAVESLRSIRDGSELSQPARSHLAFDHYEQIATLDQIRPRKDREQLIEDLLTIESGSAEPAEISVCAQRTIQFFFAVETRALQYYNRPPVSQSSYRSAWQPA